MATQKDDTLTKQLRYGFSSYSNDPNGNVEVDMKSVKKLFRKISYLYAIATGGYWEAMFDTVQSTALEDESIAIDLYDEDASAIGGVMSSIPAILIVLLKFIGSVDKIELTEKDMELLRELEGIRGNFDQSLFVEFERLSETVNFPENVLE